MCPGNEGSSVRGAHTKGSSGRLCPHTCLGHLSVWQLHVPSWQEAQEPLRGLSCAESEPGGRQAAGASGGADRLPPDLGLHRPLSNESLGGATGLF